MRIKRTKSDVGDAVASSAMPLLGIGILLGIWGGVWLLYILRHPREFVGWYYLATGVLLSGLVLAGIGFMAGKITRAASDTQPDDQPDQMVHKGGTTPVSSKRSD